MTQTACPFGLWPSPIAAKSLASDVRLESAQWDSDGRTLVWLEGRSGQGVLVAQTGDDAPRDLTRDLSVRAEVSYGGGDFTVHGGYVYFVVHKTGRIFRQRIAGGRARPITPAFGQACSPVVSPDGRWVMYVHTEDDTDRLAVVDVEGSEWPVILAAGHDFYMQPVWRGDSRQVAWVDWDHPNMPWDGTRLCVADLEIPLSGLPRAGLPRAVAGGPDIAIFQPEYLPDGKKLLYVSDETGWGRICVHDITTENRRWLTPEGVEHAAPAWQQGQRAYALSHDGLSISAARHDGGFRRAVRIEIASGKDTPIEALADYSDVSQIAAAPDRDEIVVVASAATTPARVVRHSFATGLTRIMARSSGETVPQRELIPCESIRWKSPGGETVHGLLYYPDLDRYESPGKPPLLVQIHGGPTSQVNAGWRAEAQYFATRGYAVLMVNYRGGTGYGRPYMLKLRGNWGVCDVEDAIGGMQHLAAAGRIDPNKTVVMGGSAGGFTVLETMTKHPKVFTAGISLYGVANQFHLARETHKFESRYLDTILGPLPQSADLYRDRSPEFHAHKIVRPMAIFQGDIDKVVPRAQSDVIAAALVKSGVPHVYHVYEGEGHGWRKRETIEHYYKAVEDFLQQYVLFT